MTTSDPQSMLWDVRRVSLSSLVLTRPHPFALATPTRPCFRALDHIESVGPQYAFSTLS